MKRAPHEPLSMGQMLECYRAEREALDDPLDPFPTFAVWKQEYCDEYMSRSTHRRAVDLETLMRESDREVEEAEIVLDQPEGDDIMTEAIVLNADEQAKRDARNARRRELRAAKRAGAPSTSVKNTTRAPRTGTKAEAAARIFSKMYGNHPRADIVAKFQSQAGLSPAGASTYYQKLKSAQA
jgi:hypothetical protein